MQSLRRSVCAVTPVLVRSKWCTCTYSQSVANLVSIKQNRLYSTGALAAPTPEGEERGHSPKIKSIVNEISQLTILEVADLNDLLKKTLKITDAPVMAVGGVATQAGAPAAAAPEDEEAAPPKQALFTVKLTKFDAAKKIALIKQIKGLIEGMNLVQAKKFVETVPQDIRTEVSKEEAEALQKEIEAAGGTVELV